MKRIAAGAVAFPGSAGCDWHAASDSASRTITAIPLRVTATVTPQLLTTNH